MSRPIKFRAWHKRWQKMYDWQHCQDNYTLYWLNSALMGEHVIMQYTGLKDKHGVEIYEGDVVRADTLGKSRPACEVRFAQAHYYLVSHHGADMGWAMPPSDTLEVVGNIHENPELLK